MTRWPAAALLLAGVLAAGPVRSEPDAPLDRCWPQVETRIELKSCLEALLDEAERALAVALGTARGEARELDRLTSNRYRNAARLEASQGAWSAYRDAECARRQALVEPGSGAGDIRLACRIELTEARTATLGGG